MLPVIEALIRQGWGPEGLQIGRVGLCCGRSTAHGLHWDEMAAGRSLAILGGKRKKFAKRKENKDGRTDWTN